MEEIRVQSWTELIERLHDRSWQPVIARHRSTFVFRGSANHQCALTPSLMRLGGDFASLEEHLLRTFRRYGLRYHAPDGSQWNWLALAQHHGLPTRLLDWTYSPFVALHFATADLAQFDRDSFVWCLDYVGAAALLPQRLCDVLEEEGAQVFTTEMLDAVAPSLQSFDALQDEPFMLFFEPPALNDRIVNQHGLFSITSGAGVRPDTWVAQHPTLARRIVIPASLKWEVRDKLDQANITERVLFPGLDGLSRWLKRYYSPRADVDRANDDTHHDVDEAKRAGEDAESATPRAAGEAAHRGNGTSRAASGGRAARRSAARAGRPARGR